MRSFIRSSIVWKLTLFVGVFVALNGAVFGFCAYATYDLTNQATLKNWSTMLSAIDMGWGAALTAASATAAYFVVSLVAARI